MAIAFRAVGTTSKVSSGNMSPGLPAGHALNDILLLFTNQQDNVSCSVSGWTNIAAGTGNQGSNNRIELWAKRDNGAESAPTVTHTSGGISNAIIAAYSGVDPGLTVGAAGAGSIFRDVQKQVGTSTTTVTAPALTGVIANDMRVFIGEFTVNDTSGATTNNWGTVSGFTEDKDDCSSLAGAWASSFGTDHLLASGSAGSITSTVGWTGAFTSWNWQAIQLALSQDASTVASFPIFRPMMLTLQGTPVQPPLSGPPFSSSIPSQLFQQALTATATTTASFVNQVGKLLTATATTTATIVKQVGKPLSATVTSTATIIKQVNKLLSATVTTTATIAAIKVILKTLSATVTTTATIVKQVNKLLSATVTTTASIVKQVNKLLSATATTTATLAAIKVILRTLTATVTTTATMVRQVGLHLSPTVSTTASIVKRVSKTLSATATSSASLQALKVILKTLTATVTTTASLATQIIKAILGFFEGSGRSADIDPGAHSAGQDSAGRSSDIEGDPNSLGQ